MGAYSNLKRKREG